MVSLELDETIWTRLFLFCKSHPPTIQLLELLWYLLLLLLFVICYCYCYSGPEKIEPIWIYSFGLEIFIVIQFEFDPIILSQLFLKSDFYCQDNKFLLFVICYCYCYPGPEKIEPISIC